MKVLLLSAYDANSHQYWREGVVKYFPEYQWTVLTLPARFFSWRIRGNSLTWAFTQKETLEQRYDLIIATSMVDLSALRGMCPNLTRIPTILYFHENQFAYPASAEQHASVEPQMVQLYSAACADLIVFNSHYNRSTFWNGLSALLKKLPDGVPSELISHLQDKSSVLPVPLQHVPGTKKSTKRHRFSLVWNHRWEYDKGPDNLLYFIRALPPDLEIDIHVIGQSFRKLPDAFDQIQAILKRRGWIGRWGYIDDVHEYRQLLCQSHVVLSTAQHDFQGLSILEGVASGCVPLVPDRLAYGDFIEDVFRYSSLPEDPEREGRAAALKLVDIQKGLESGDIVAPDLSQLSWDYLQSDYERLFNRLVSLGKQ